MGGGGKSVIPATTGGASGRGASERVARWTPRFFRLLEETTFQENAGLAQAGPVVLRIGERTVRIVD